MIRVTLRGLKIISILIAALALSIGPGGTTELDYTGAENIIDQEWKLEFTLLSMGEETFSVRLPFPDYTYKGKWATYSTHKDSVYAVGECGPILYELYHYNQGYSNQGVWLKMIYCTCYENTVHLTVRQSAKLDLPGLDYPLTLHTNNPWMDGSNIVDVYSPIVENVLSEALALPGDWHQRGWRGVPEQIVNWMNENMSWSGSYQTHYPKSASQVLTERVGHCEEWAHAACALFLKAGIAAKVVMAGTLPTYNSTQFRFNEPDWHLCVAYWDGFGWILIDPYFSSGFSIVNRVILGADRDSWGLKIRTNPEYLLDHIANVDFDYTEGNYSGSLYEVQWRCTQYQRDILEHYEYAAGPPLEGFEPICNIVPNTPTEAEYTCPEVSSIHFSNHPNPFNPVTTFSFIVNRPGTVRIDLFSVEGKYLETACEKYCDAGLNEISWHCASIPSGVYFARISTRSGTATRKVVILR
jgi:hypothetical protein